MSDVILILFGGGAGIALTVLLLARAEKITFKAAVKLILGII